MKKLISVSITILLTISIDVCVSQFAAIHQPKSIRNGAAFHQEIFYGNELNNQQQNLQNHHHDYLKHNNPQPLVHKPIFPPKPVTTRAPSPTTTLKSRVAVPDDDEFENTPRPIRPAVVRPVQQVSAFSVTTAATTQRTRTTTEALTSAELEEQAKSAYYNFGTEVRDTINDHEHVRHEARDGLTLKGMYSYSDGFFRRTVHYEADEGGYRVTKEEIDPITGDGPRFNPKGHADVKSTLAGDYSITVDDFRLNKQQEKILLGDKK